MPDCHFCNWHPQIFSLNSNPCCSKRLFLNPRRCQILSGYRAGCETTNRSQSRTQVHTVSFQIGSSQQGTTCQIPVWRVRNEQWGTLEFHAPSLSLSPPSCREDGQEVVQGTLGLVLDCLDAASGFAKETQICKHGSFQSQALFYFQLQNWTITRAKLPQCALCLRG